MSKIIDTSEPKQAPGGRFKKPAIMLGILLILVAGVTAVVMMKPSLNPLSKNSDAEKPKTAEEIYDKASSLASSKNVGEANKYYDEQIAAAKDNKAKAALLMDKASVAYNAGDFAAALKAAQDADALTSTAGTLGMIAQSYEGKGDKANALEYYKKALAVLPKSEVTNRQEVSLKSKIEELSH